MYGELHVLSCGYDARIVRLMLTIELFGIVGLWPLTDEIVSMRLRENVDSPVLVLLNSEGGDAFMGEAIRAQLATRDTTVRVTGLAASAAATIAMGGRRIEMTENSALMLHRSETTRGGNVEQLRKSAEALSAVDEGLVQLYTRRTGKTEKTVRAWLESETFFTAEEALEAKLIDAILPAAPTQVKTSARMPARILNALAIDPKKNGKDTPPSNTPDTPAPGQDMDLKIIAKKLGLPETATEAEVTAALDARNAMIAPAPQPVAPATPPAADPDADAIAAAALAAISAMQPPEADQIAAQATELVDSMIKSGKIPPANRAMAIQNASASKVTLAACRAIWTNQPKIVNTITPTANPPTQESGPSKQLKIMLQKSGITYEQYLATKTAMAEGDPRFPRGMRKEKSA